MRNHTFILPTGLDLGGVVTWSVAMAGKLTARGEAATVVRHRTDSPKPAGAIAEAPAVRMIDCPGPSAWNAFSTEQVQSYLPTYAGTLPATVVPNWSYATYAACALLSQTNAPDLRVLGFCHADEAGYYDWLGYYESIIHTFVAVSDDIAVKLRATLPHRVDDIVTRPYGVNVEPSLDRRYSGGQEPIRLMYAGRIETTQKRIRDLVTLARLLTERGIDFDLRVLGSGSEEDWFRQQVDQITTATGRARIVMEGSVPHDQMRERWRSADICVLVSNYEGTSIAMLEAMAQGCVPVVTEVSGTRAVLDPGVNGFVVPIGDMTGMADLVDQLVRDRTGLQSMGAAAHRTVYERYSFERYLPWFEDLSRQAWEMPPRAWPADRPLLHRTVEGAPPQLSVGQRLTAKAGRIARRLMGRGTPD